MTVIRNRNVTIKWRLNPDAFAIINKSVITDITRKIGSSRKGVSEILLKEDLLDTTMPHLVNLNPSDQGFKKEITNYWNSLSVEVPENGKELEIGFRFDKDDKHKSDRIKVLMTSKKLTTDEDLASYVMLNVPIEERYKYGTPIKIEDYLLYIYCQNYRDVANEPEDIAKASSHIRFYIEDAELLKKQKDELVKLNLKAQGKLIDLIKNEKAPTLIYNILCVLEPTEISVIDASDNDDRRNRIWDLATRSPKEFIDIMDDENLHIKSLIERLLNKHILRKLPNTDVITDVDDPSIVIGNTTSEAISWFSNETNKAKISEYETILKEKK